MVESAWGLGGREVAFHLSGKRALKMFQGEGAAGNRPGGGPGRAAGRRQVKRGELGPELGRADLGQAVEGSAGTVQGLLVSAVGVKARSDVCFGWKPRAPLRRLVWSGRRR